MTQFSFSRYGTLFAIFFVAFLLFTSAPGICEVADRIRSKNVNDTNLCRIAENTVTEPAKNKLPSPYGDAADAEPDPFHFVKAPDRSAAAIASFIKGFESTVIDYYPCRQEFSELCMAFHYVLGMKHPIWDDDVYLKDDGRLVRLTGFPTGIKQAKKFRAITEEWGGRFLVVTHPFVLGFEDKDFYYGCHSERNISVDNCIALVRKENMDLLDLRQVMKDAGLSMDDLSFRGDHHWNVKGALYGAYYIAEKLNRDYGMAYDLEHLKEDAYRKITYKDMFIGSLAKKVSCSYLEREDFTMFYPNYPTAFTFEYQSSKHAPLTRQDGDFSVLMFYENIEYPQHIYSAYSVYLNSDRYFVRIVNNKIKTGPKILLFKNSFVNAMIPFLALQSREIVMMDERYTRDDCETILRREKPDIVIYFNSYFDDL